MKRTGEDDRDGNMGLDRAGRPGISGAGILRKAEAKNRAGRAEKNSERIDHLHYYDPDEYECPKCGARFSRNVMTCPKCGMKFTGSVEDDEPYEEEYEMWDGDDDEDD